jgi:hypothetical protein
MIPLEIHGMVRACRPITPHVGLYRQSRDPERTKVYYEEARKIRDIQCFHSMLKQATLRCLGYRAIRRLWIQTLYQILNIRQFKHYFVRIILEYIPNKEPERIPLYFSKHYSMLDYHSLSPKIRMQQIAGKLCEMGYSRMVLPVPDYELEEYRILTYDDYTDDSSPTFYHLYHELKRKNIVNKWPILSSWILHENGYLVYKKREWIQLCKQDRLRHYLNMCIRANHLSREEIRLLRYWMIFLQYPNR